MKGTLTHQIALFLLSCLCMFMGSMLVCELEAANNKNNGNNDVIATSTSKTTASVVPTSVSTITAITNANSSEIIGRITDAENGEAMLFANVALRQNGLFVMGTTTDEDGFYALKPLEAGLYEIEFSFIGYQTQKITNVNLAHDQILTLNAQLQVSDNIIGEFVLKAYVEPLIIPGKSPSRVSFTPKTIKSLPTRDVQSMAAMSGGVFQADEGDDFNVRGARTGSTLYIIDGVKSDELYGVPPSAIGQMEVITGGIPAKYGDATSGVIIINTKSFLNAYDY